MDVLAISPETDYPDEPLIIESLLDAGLFRYHLRKPAQGAVEVVSLLERVPPACLPHIVLHQYPELVTAFGLGGYHFKDRAQAVPERDAWRLQPAVAACVGVGLSVSRSLHCIDALEGDCAGWDYVLISPVFSSISKITYRPAWSELELSAALTSSAATGKRYALGGVCAANAARCSGMGFDGVALHGALWRAADPVAELKTCLERINA